MAPHPTRPWRAELLLRMRRHFLLKLLGVSAFMWVFFIGYFHTLRNPAFPVFQMPLTAVDRLIPFQPEALAAYLSLWLYVGIVPGLMLHLRDAVRHGVWAAALCATGLACFYFWPTSVPDPGIDRAAHAGFGLLQGVDAAGNACPSLHVAAAMFAAVWIDRLLRHVGAPAGLRLLNAIWFVAIAYSTLATKQHVALDVLAGGLLGAAFAGLSLRRWEWNEAAPAA